MVNINLHISLITIYLKGLSNPIKGQRFSELYAFCKKYIYNNPLVSTKDWFQDPWLPKSADAQGA